MKDIVSFELAILLKELKFNMKTTEFYVGNGTLHTTFEAEKANRIDHNIKGPRKYRINNIYFNDIETPYSAPTLAQAQQFILEMYGIYVMVECILKEKKDKFITYIDGTPTNLKPKCYFSALEGGIKEVIKSKEWKT